MATAIALPGILARTEADNETPTPTMAPLLASPASRWQLPPSFRCPISQQCMHNPVVLSDGHTYERLQIELWLQEHDTSPVSGLHLPQRDFLPNHALRNAIEEYVEQVLKEHRDSIWRMLTGAEEQNAAFSLASAVGSLVEWSLAINTHLGTEGVVLGLIDEAKTMLGAEAISVMLLNASRQELVPLVKSTDGEDWAAVHMGIDGKVAESGEAVVIDDAVSDKCIAGCKPRNVMCVPVKGKEGEILGVAHAINKTTRTGEFGDGHGLLAGTVAKAFSARDQDFLQVFAAQTLAAVARVNKSEVPQSPRVEPQSEYLVGVPVMKSTEVKKNHADAEVLLERAFGGWQFDAFELAEVTANRPLSVLATYLFNKLGFVQEFNLDQEKMSCFFAEIESGYADSNSYHNRAHAASVLHAMHALLEHGGLMKVAAAAFDDSEDGKPDAEGDRLGKLEHMACLLAAAIHDYDHVGLSNDFLVKTSHERAVQYNDQHVNEQHHVAAAFSVLLRPEFNFLAQLTARDYRRLRGLAIDLVLSTDMADNNAIVRSFTNLVDSQLGELASANVSGTPAATFRPTTRAEASLLLQVAMKCADLGHLALDWDLHVRWVALLEEEFFCQGDREKAIGMSTSFLMDREKPGASATQVGFFDYVVLPLFRSLHRAVPTVQSLLDSLMANYESWKEYKAQPSAKVDKATDA